MGTTARGVEGLRPAVALAVFLRCGRAEKRCLAPVPSHPAVPGEEDAGGTALARVPIPVASCLMPATAGARSLRALDWNWTKDGGGFVFFHRA